MRLKDFLNFSLIQTEHFSITIYTLFVIMMVVVSTVLMLKLLKRIFIRLSNKETSSTGNYWSIYLLIKYFIWVIICILLLDTIGLKISVLLASFAALLVGVGLGIQQLFSDIASGIVILVERKLKINDIIQFEDGTVGKVIDLGIRTSMFKTRDDIILVVPNSKFVNNKIINWSHIDFNTRFNVKVAVAYGSDVEKVKEILLQCAHENHRISLKPIPFVRFNDFGEYFLEFQLYFWVEDSFLVENIKSDLRFSINKAFQQNNIRIPFPQTDIHIKENKMQEPL